MLKERENLSESQLDPDPGDLIFIPLGILLRHSAHPRQVPGRSTVAHGFSASPTEDYDPGRGAGQNSMVALPPVVARTSGATFWQPLDGPINGDEFQAYVRHVLSPERRPGNFAIMGNHSSRKRPAMREMIGAAGATLHCSR